MIGKEHGKKILVQLVSEQTIPNILAVHHFSPDEVLFISTDAMERQGKTAAIVRSLSRLGIPLENRYASIVVREDSLLDCHRKLDSWMDGREDSEFIVNLTCGTKIMAIAAFKFFEDYPSRMIYVPLPKNEYITPFPKKLNAPAVPLSLRLDVVSYLAAYGLQVINEWSMVRRREDGIKRKELAGWIALNYDKVKNLLVWLGGALREHRDDNCDYHFRAERKEASLQEKELLATMGFSYDGSVVSKRLTRSEIGFLTGDWLEDYCFNEVRAMLGQGVDDVVVGLKLKNKDGGDNEFDVMFTRDNALYFVECKSLDQHEDRSQNQALYKIGALSKNFGLRVKSFLLTTAPGIMKNGEIRPSVLARADQFGATIIPPGRTCEFRRIVCEKLKLPAAESL